MRAESAEKELALKNATEAIGNIDRKVRTSTLKIIYSVVYTNIKTSAVNRKQNFYAR